MRQLINISVSLLFRFEYVLRKSTCLASVARYLMTWRLCVVCNTSITTSNKSRASGSSIRNPASNETISDFVELWDTDVCFLHIQLMEKNVRLPKIHKIPPEIDFVSPQGRQQNLSHSTNSIDNAEPSYPHDNTVGSHWCDECMKSIWPNVCHKLVHLVTDRASLLTDHEMPGPRIRASTMHFKTTCEQISDNSSVFSNFSFLIW